MKCASSGSCVVGLAFLFSCVADPPDVSDALPTLADGTRIELVDVGVIWPLPPGTGPKSGEGFLGPILSCEDLEVFEPLTRTDEPEVLCASLTVTAVRLDPCAQTLVGDACRPELRIVLQPVVDGEARDASIHAFYDIDERDLARAIATMAKLRTDAGFDGKSPLRVHPLLETAGGRADVASALQPAIDAATLTQFTQITVHGDDAAWTFEFRPFVDGAPSPGEAIQQHVLSPTDDVIAISVTPVAASADDFAVLLDEDLAADASASEQQEAYDRAANVLHPERHTANTIDCARCHLATPARVAADARATMAESENAFTSARHDLRPSDVFANPQFIHALAWRHTSLAVNGRVVNETARSADVAEDILRTLGVLP